MSMLAKWFAPSGPRRVAPPMEMVAR